MADGTNGDVIKVPVGGGTAVAVASGLTSLEGVAVDANGNVYITADNAVTEYPFGGGSPIPMGSGYANPNGVAADASGAVYVADAGNARIVRVAAGGASQANLAITGITNPQGVTVDGAGNIYVTDSGNMIEINRTQAAPLVFASTNIGSTSTSQPVTVSNAGNQLLTVSNLAITTNFVQVPSGGSDCTSSSQLSASGQCTVAVAFAPTAGGTLTGTVTLTDNALNNSTSAQTVQLSGSGTQIAQTITFGALSNQVLGTPPFTLSASASSGLAVSFASTTPTVCTVSGTTAALVAVGTCTIQATQAGNADYAAAPPVNQSFQVTQEGQTITFEALSNRSLGTAPFPLSATASSGLAVSFASTTSAVCTVSSATVTLVAAGTCTIQATQAGNINYSAAPPVNQSFQVSDFTITSTPSSTSVTAGKPGTFTLTLTPQGSFTSAISLSCGGLPAMAGCTFTPATTVTLNASTVTTTLNITTAAHTTALALPPSGHRSSPLYAVCLLLPAMFLGTLRMAKPKGRKLLSYCLVFLLVGGCLFQAACSGASSLGVNTTTGTPAGTYSVVVTGAAGSNQHTTTIMLTVN